MPSLYLPTTHSFRETICQFCCGQSRVKSDSWNFASESWCNIEHVSLLCFHWENTLAQRNLVFTGKTLLHLSQVSFLLNFYPDSSSLPTHLNAEGLPGFSPDDLIHCDYFKYHLYVYVY